jgi:signal peptidase II
MIEKQNKSTQNLYTLFWPVVIVALAFALDRVSKLWAADFFATNGTTAVHPYLTLTQTFNRGIALGLFQGIGPLVGWLSIGVIAVLLIMLLRTPASNRLLRIGLAVTIGGAAGNLIDRIVFGEVLDFLVVPLRTGVFNVADVLIYLGMALILLGSWSGNKPPEPK